MFREIKLRKKSPPKGVGTKKWFVHNEEMIVLRNISNLLSISKTTKTTSIQSVEFAKNWQKLYCVLEKHQV